jgi:nucleotide-binding universal stress UspA family protein
MSPSDPIVAGIALRDDDDAVLALAAELARATGAPLVLLHAHPFQPLIAIPPPRWVEEQRAAAVARLETLALGLAGPVTVQAAASPSPVRALHETAEALGARLLVAGSSHRSPSGRVLPGGVGERLLHAAPCAVAIAPRDYTRPPEGLRRIGVGYTAGREGTEALALATELARRCGAHVTTYTVVVNHRAGLPEILEAARAGVPTDLLEDTVVRQGDPAAELAAASADLDLLICGSRGYGPVRSLLLGGITWELAHTARCPLLVVARASVE